MKDLKENNVWYGFIPFTIEDIQFGDRVYHFLYIQTMKRKNRVFKAYLWKVVWMERDNDFPEDNKLFTIYTDLWHWIVPSFGKWDIQIDRRPRYKRILDRLLELTQ
jgi:hypothetical protein